MKLNKKIFLFLIAVFFSISLFSQVALPGKILFVGNSYTYFGNLPQMVQAMAENKGIELETRQSTAGGVTWGHHWREERGLSTVKSIETGDFDAIVLQNHSMSAINRVDSMFHFGQLFSDLAEKNGAQIYLYMTWAREWDPYMQKSITEAYTKLAEKINAHIVPVGPAWQRARQLRPGLPLYDDDGSHPSTLGTYLTACVFYGILTQQSPVGLPQSLISHDKDGERIYLSIQSQGDALFCQKVAEEIMNSWDTKR